MCLQDFLSIFGLTREKQREREKRGAPEAGKERERERDTHRDTPPRRKKAKPSWRKPKKEERKNRHNRINNSRSRCG